MTAMPNLDLSGTAPITDADAARLASPAAFTDLASQIMATPVPAARSRARWTDAVRAGLLAPRAIRGGQMRPSSATGRPVRSRKRLVLWLTAPAAAAAALAVALSGLSAPSQPTYTLDALLTVHPPAHPGDAAAVLRRLAARAAVQPAQALGPVEYSSNREWEDIGLNVPRNLNYLSRQSWTNQAWNAVSGASAVHSVRHSDGKVFTSSYPADRWSAQLGAWANPATLPDSLPALRQRLLHEPGVNVPYWHVIITMRDRTHGKLSPPQERDLGDFTSRLAAEKTVRWYQKHDAVTNVQIRKIGPFGYGTWQSAFVANAIRIMGGEPLSPAVHSAMLEVLAQIATNPGRDITYVDMGTATDHLGRTGVVIGEESTNPVDAPLVGLNSLIFDPRTGALLDVADATCKIPMGATPRATGQCVPVEYTEYNLPRAVPAVPHYRAHIPGLYHQAGGPYF
jgi:hypothetical protein